jgi:hypothetical protein
MPQDEKDHRVVCKGEVRQCLTCGGRMCDCGSVGLLQTFYSAYCGTCELADQVFADLDYEPLPA